MGAMSITSSRNEKFFGPFMYGVSFVPSPNRYRNDFGLDGEAGDLACANAVEQEIHGAGPGYGGGGGRRTGLDREQLPRAIASILARASARSATSTACC